MFQIVKHAPFILLIIIATIYYLFIRKRRERYSSIERIAFYFALMGQLTNIMMNSNIEIATIAHLTRLKIGRNLYSINVITWFILGTKRNLEFEYSNQINTLQSI